MINAQEWLDRNYPKENRHEIKELKLGGKDLEGGLDLNEFTDLKRLELYRNKISSLKVDKCINLKGINIDVNELTELDLSKNTSLEALAISDNNFSEQDLSFLSHLTELRHLAIQNYYRGKDAPFYNKFKGSLKTLKNTRMKELFIANTNISEGLEYLPYLERFLVGTGQDSNINNSFYNFTNDKQRPYLQGYTKIFSNLQRRASELQKKEFIDEQRIKELSNTLFPNQPYNFTQLKQEITRLKIKELAPQVREKREELEQLINNSKNKAGVDFEKIIDLLLETQKQIVKQENNVFFQGQLTAYQNILQTKLSQEELQILLDRQTELFQLEEHLVSLQEKTHIKQPTYDLSKLI